MYMQAQAIIDTRRHLKDTTQNVWTDDDIKQFINDAIALIRKSVPLYFVNLYPVPYDDDGVQNFTINIDPDYELLIPIFASARCFEQDEQHYRAVQKMNEFESRKIDMVNEILDSDRYAETIKSLGETGVDAVKDVYFNVVTSIETPVGLL